MASRFVFTPESAQFPGSAFPALKKDAQSRMVVAFDAAADEECYWTAVAPENFSGASNVNVVVSYYMATASGSTNNVVFAVAIEAPSASEDVDSGAYFATDSSLTSPIPATQGYYKQATIGVTPALQDALAASNYFRMRLKRLATNAFDTATGDAHVLAVEFKDSV